MKYKVCYLWVIALSITCFLKFSFAQDYQKIQWIDLLPEDDLKALTEASIPDSIFEGSAADTINSELSMTIKDPVTEYERALVSVRVRDEYDGRKVKLPGYIVPVETTEDGKTTEFFFVPFFGACIHLPPPPPNQIIYASYPSGLPLNNFDEAYWIEATIATKQHYHNLATAAYTASVDNFYIFKEDDQY